MTQTEPIRRQLSSAAGEPEGGHLASPDNLAPVLSTVTWVLLAVDIFMVAALFTLSRGTFYMTRRFNLISAVTLALCTGQSIAVSLQAHYGFGRHLDTISTGDLQAVFKSLYANELLYVLALASTKFLFASFLYDLTRVRGYNTAVWILAAAIAAWTFSSFVVVAFQCSVPETWNLVNQRCIDHTAFWTSFGILDMVMNVALMAFSIRLVVSFHISTAWRKARLSANFAIRILAVTSMAVQTAFLRADEADVGQAAWRTQLLAQITLTVSVVVSAVPMLQPFPSALESGMLRVDDLRRQDRQGSYANTAQFGTFHISRIFTNTSRSGVESHRDVESPKDSFPSGKLSGP